MLWWFWYEYGGVEVDKLDELKDGGVVFSGVTLAAANTRIKGQSSPEALIF